MPRKPIDPSNEDNRSVEERAREAAEVTRMKQRQGVGPQRVNKFGTEIKSSRSMPYVDPVEHSSLGDYLREWDRMMHHYEKSAGKNCLRKRMVLAVSSVKIDDIEYQVLVSSKAHSTAGESERGLVYNYPGGKVYPNEQPWQAAKREFTEETGLMLADDQIVGVIAPARPEAEEITQPWIVYVFRGRAALVYQHELQVKPKGEKASPCLVQLDKIGGIRALSNIQPIASLVNSYTGDFVMEAESMSGHCVSRITTYRPNIQAIPLPMKYAHIALEQ